MSHNKNKFEIIEDVKHRKDKFENDLKLNSELIHFLGLDKDQIFDENNVVKSTDKNIKLSPLNMSWNHVVLRCNLVSETMFGQDFAQILDSFLMTTESNFSYYYPSSIDYKNIIANNPYNMVLGFQTIDGKPINLDLEKIQKVKALDFVIHLRLKRKFPLNF